MDYAARLAEVGVGPETELTAFMDGAGAMRQLAARVGADGLPILQWYHIAMRLHPIRQAADALGTRVPSRVRAKKAICKAVEWCDETFGTVTLTTPEKP